MSILNRTGGADLAVSGLLEKIVPDCYQYFL